jgi:tetratricopeptide (TPR) repeat protein
LAAWPAFASRTAADDPAAALTPAPLRDDATIRARTIAFEEARAASDGGDQITPRLLAAQYLQRYRERGDAGDVLRAEAAARLSLRRQPRNNVAALQELAAAQVTLHRFRDALATIRTARDAAPLDAALAASEVSVDLELGDYGTARMLLARLGGAHTQAAHSPGAEREGTETVAARFAELTGDLVRARTLLSRATRRADAVYGMPNERRAWFHVRLAELAFEAGDADAALREVTNALDRFPDDAQALTDGARFWAALDRPSEAKRFAERAVRMQPSPENLGLLADAQERLGDRAAAAATRDQIVAVERIGNAQHLVDRLLALEYADHATRAGDAYAIARRELAVRDDVFAEDTLAWTAARAGRWREAAAAARRATAWNTADPRIWYHAGVVAEHAGDTRAALADYRHALALNRQFAPGFADDARTRAARLENLTR